MSGGLLWESLCRAFSNFRAVREVLGTQMPHYLRRRVLYAVPDCHKSLHPDDFPSSLLPNSLLATAGKRQGFQSLLQWVCSKIRAGEREESRMGKRELDTVYGFFSFGPLTTPCTQGQGSFRGRADDWPRHAKSNWKLCNQHFFSFFSFFPPTW